MGTDKLCMSPVSKDVTIHNFSPVGNSHGDILPFSKSHIMNGSVLLQHRSEICTEISSAKSLLELTKALSRAQCKVAEALAATPPEQPQTEGGGCLRAIQSPKNEQPEV